MLESTTPLLLGICGGSGGDWEALIRAVVLVGVTVVIGVVTLLVVALVGTIGHLVRRRKERARAAARAVAIVGARAALGSLARAEGLADLRWARR